MKHMTTLHLGVYSNLTIAVCDNDIHYSHTSNK